MHLVSGIFVSSDIDQKPHKRRVITTSGCEQRPSHSLHVAIDPKTVVGICKRTSQELSRTA